MRRTPLYDRHLAAGAKIVPFAGWEMPVQYDGIRQEHTAVREAVGIFDTSHMGEVETSGPDATKFLQHLLSNDIEQIPIGGAQYSVLCREDGGVLDDTFTYRLGEQRYLTVTNAANHERDSGWLRDHSEGYDVELEDRLDDYAMIAVQGPKARALVTGLLKSDDGNTSDGDDDVSAVKPELPARFKVATLNVAGTEMLVCGTGYTGEDGVELLCPPAAAPAVWDALVAAGAKPCGLGARDTLRLEVCYHLYGNDLMIERGPIEAGLGWCCKEQTGFIGSEAIAKTRAAGPTEKLVAFKLTDPGIARQGNPVVGGGEVTSGTLSPSLNVSIGMAYLPTARTTVGEPFTIDVRGRTRQAVVVAKPIYHRDEA